MITFLEGILVEKQPTRIVLNVGGVGYEVLIPLSSYDRLPGPKEPTRVLTHDYVREDTHVLFGFATEPERSLFEKLLAINGIGPKLALSALSGMSVRELTAAVIDADVKRLSSISGVGKKMAERMVVELRDRFSAGEALEATAGEPELPEGDFRTRDAILALISLGYKQNDARKMVRATIDKQGPDASVEEIVRTALVR